MKHLVVLLLFFMGVSYAKTCYIPHPCYSLVNEISGDARLQKSSGVTFQTQQDLNYNAYHFPYYTRISTKYKEEWSVSWSKGIYKKKTVANVITNSNFRGYKVIHTDPTDSKSATAGYQLQIFHRKFSDGRSFAGRMDSPVIFSQGFDPDWGTDDEITFNRFQNILGGVTIQGLLDRGYSVVLMRYQNPGVSIDWNALAALDALKWIQSQAPGKDLKIVGPSMGGLIMRKALIYGASENANIHPKNFIAYDSPNWGAVVPITLQYSLKKLKEDDADMERRYDNLMGDAAGQMLLYRVGSDNQEILGYFAHNGAYINSKSSKYLRSLNSSTNWSLLRQNKAQDGSPIKVLAVTDGTANVSQGLPQNTQYAKIDFTSLFVSLATGHTGSKTQVAHVDPAGIGDYRLQFKEPVFTENLPGGLRDSYQSTKDAFEKDEDWTIFDEYKGTWNGSFLNTYKTNGTLSTHKGHCFVPTVSAAAVRLTGSDATAYEVFNQESGWKLPSGTSTLSNSQSWFDEVYINQASRNQLHIRDAVYPDVGDNFPKQTILQWIGNP